MAQPGLHPEVLLPQSPGGWVCRLVPPHPACCVIVNKILFLLPLSSMSPRQKTSQPWTLFPPSGLHGVFHDGDGLQDHCLRPLLLLPEEVEYLRLRHRHREPAGAEHSQEGQPVCASDLPPGNVITWPLGKLPHRLREADL